MTLIATTASRLPVSGPCGFTVLQAGVLTLVQDAGRFGYHDMGLSNGGPIDSNAFRWANCLCENEANASVLEISIGGLVLEAQRDSVLALAGATMPLFINGLALPLWQSFSVRAGDRIEIGYAMEGCRSYLAVSGGFSIAKVFSSTSTVVREAVGGLRGTALQSGDVLPCESIKTAAHLQLALNNRPQYIGTLELRLVLGYQYRAFDDTQIRRFFSSEYTVSPQSDRMGYRLQGPAVKASMTDVLSEGNCLGAVQIPADGQPIVLLNDRQTIGGYPKIGSVLGVDCSRLGQLGTNCKVSFSPVTIEQAQQQLRSEVPPHKSALVAVK